MKKSVSLICALAVLLSGMFLVSCKSKVYYFDNSESEPVSNVHVQNNVVIDKTVFPENTSLYVKVLKSGDEMHTIAEKAIPDALSLSVYDITAKSMGSIVEPKEPVNVIFPLPKKYKENKHFVQLYYIDENGAKTLIESKITNEGIVAKLSHFSVYVVALFEKQQDEEVNVNNGTNSNTEGSGSGAGNKNSGNANSENTVSGGTSSVIIGNNVEIDIGGLINGTSSKPVNSTVSKPSGNTSSDSSGSSSSDSSGSASSDSSGNTSNDGWTGDYIIDRN